MIVNHKCKLKLGLERRFRCQFKLFKINLLWTVNIRTGFTILPQCFHTGYAERSL